MYSFADPYITSVGQMFVRIMQLAVYITVCRYNTILHNKNLCVKGLVLHYK